MHLVSVSMIRALTLGAAVLGLAAGAGAATPFAITATNVTMPNVSNGVSTSSFTVTGIPAAGQLGITCEYSGGATTAKTPVCGGGPVFTYTVTQGETLTGKINIYPYGVPIPVAMPAAAGVLAGGLLLLGLGRRRMRWLTLLLAAGVGALAVSACGSEPMTPGTYTYTLRAGNTAGNTTLVQSTSTTFTVTVE